MQFRPIFLTKLFHFGFGRQRTGGMWLIGLVWLVWLFASYTPSLAQTEPVSTVLVEAEPATLDDAAVVEQIDALIQRGLEDFEFQPSRRATDSEWCRRVYLDVLGRIPTVDEALQFLDDKRDDKRRRLVETLVYDDQYTDEFARNWTTVWTNLLIGRTGGMANNSMINREGMQQYLRDVFASDKPYDKMCYELVTANGTTTPGDPKFNGAANFLIDKVNNENAAQATSATTRLFLGLQVQCTQCHNHPFNDWKQQKYWETNAFFRQVQAFPGEVRVRDGGVAELADQDFAGETGRNPGEAEIFYEKRNGLVAVAYPVFVDGTEIDRSGYVNVTNRRVEFANLMIDSPYFSQAMVNRTWAHFLGYGFTAPVEDLGPHNRATHPRLLEYLAQEFVDANFDFRRLIVWVALSQPYQLSSRSKRGNSDDDPALGQPPRFSHFYLRQMEAEQLYESLLTSTQPTNARGSYEEQERIKSRWLRQFSRAFGNDEGQESTSFNGTIPQVLMMFNGEMIRRAIGTGPGSLIDELVTSKKRYPQCVDHLFMATLTRRPEGRERRMANDFLAARRGDTKEALKDVLWVLLNSNEFIFNH